MPQSYNNAVITDAGLALLNKAQTGMAAMQFTRMAIGDGMYSADEKTPSALQKRVALKSERNSYVLSSMDVTSSGGVKLTALLTNQDPVTEETLVTEGYYVNEIGLYAKEKSGGDDTEALYSIAIAVVENREYMPAFAAGQAPAQIVQEYFAVISNASEVAIHCAGAAMLAEDGEKLLEQVTAKQAWGSENAVTGKDSYAFGNQNNNAGASCFVSGNNNKIDSASKNVVVFGNDNVAEGALASLINGAGNILASWGCLASGNASAIANGDLSLVSGRWCETSAECASALGFLLKARTMGGIACGRYNAVRETALGYSGDYGDAFVVGNGERNAGSGYPSIGGTSASEAVAALNAYRTERCSLSNAFRVSYSGDVYGLKAYNSSGADYAEFIKPWADGNEGGEDRVGYFVTVKDGFLYKADDGDYIIGITSGNPSIVGNSDEDYYWRYERDAFNRIELEDVPELVVKRDEEGKPVFNEDGSPEFVDTGRIVKRMKISEKYKKSLQANYEERKQRKEWDYVGMLGVLPLRDDGTCAPGRFCKCKGSGVATLAEERGFDTYMVLERVTDNVISVVFK